MKRFVLCLPVLVVLVMGMVGVANAVPILGLSDTGQGAPGTIDPNYQLISAPGGVTGAVILDPTKLHPFWLQAPGWIGVNDDTTLIPAPSDPGGTYIYRITVDLTGFDLSTVSISGNFGADDTGGIRVNSLHIPGIVANLFTLTGFSLNSGNASFVSGINTIDFRVFNVTQAFGNPTGLIVTSLGGDGQLTSVPVPAPASLLLLGIGLAGLGFSRRVTLPRV